jgi:hypothetical protein
MHLFLALYILSHPQFHFLPSTLKVKDNSKTIRTVKTT